MDFPLLIWILAICTAVASAAAVYFWRESRRQPSSDVSSFDQQRFTHYASILENCDDTSWLVDADTRRLIYVTPSAARLRGWPMAKLIGKPIHELLPPTMADKVDVLIDGLRKRSSSDPASCYSERVELEVPMKNGYSMPVETEYKVLFDSDGKPSLLLGISRDITERKRLESALREGEERVRLALHCSGDGVWDLNLQSREMSYLEGWEDVLGYRADELKSTFDAYLALIHDEDRDMAIAEIERHLAGDPPSFHCEYRMQTRDGGWRWVLSRGLLWSRTPEGLPLRMVGTHTDITARKVAEVAMSRTNVKLHTQIDEIRSLQGQLAEQAVRDPLTALYNRRYLDETLDREVARARREGNPLSVVMLDVDHFKNLNDSYGHQAGDQVLKALADLLREDTRAEDVPCRYGGEEFLVLLPSMSLEHARERAEHWRRQLEQHTFSFGNFSLTATASFGVSSYPHHGKTPDELTGAADAALYHAKRNGRNRVEVFDESPIVFVTGRSSSAG